MKRYQLFIHNEWVDPAHGAWFESSEPFSGVAWAEIPRGDGHDVDRAVRAAHAAFENPEWRDITATQRGALLRKLGDLVTQNVDLLAQTEQRDNGKLIKEVSGQVHNVAQWFHYYAGLADKVQGAVVPINKTGVFNYVKHEPLGVVAAITPWNSPLALTVWKIAPALAAGNTMVIKPSEFTSASLLELAALVKQAGFPPGVVNYVTNAPADAAAVVEAMIAHPAVRRVNFTGSTKVGRIIAQTCAKYLKPAVLELGGKAPFVVLDDADIDDAVNAAAFGSFANSGQICMSTERIIVDQKIADAFVKQFADKARSLPLGDPRKSEPVVLGSVIGMATVEH